MRYRTMWEHTGPETVVVCDIHDDINILAKQIEMMVNCMDRLKRDIGMTYWESDDEECLSSVPLPLRGHCHIDGGVCVWRKGDGRARTLARKKGCFMAYCASLLFESTIIPRGIDEMFVDAFLAACDIKEKYGLFLPHKHRIREAAEIPDYRSELEKKDQLNENIQLDMAKQGVGVKEHKLYIGSKTNYKCLTGDLIYICHEKKNRSLHRFS
eukprot:CAMPEP_0184046934 /NCGR_PEP_ID=MMETSP0956-20121227/1865_1 /TAXON_ID=627963 /ORGANISM="Aplanochytrium sp, Strain PBS07" /LENGTH=211 /DNA_ID=CAMNT_0026338639 /DNA_START=49 /DNA_END=684 /DNA_ORIENTATION=+